MSLEAQAEVPKVVMDLTAKEDQINLLEAMQDHVTQADEQVHQFSVLKITKKTEYPVIKILKSINPMIF